MAEAYPRAATAGSRFLRRDGRSAEDVQPKTAQAIDTSSCRAPKRRISNQERAHEDAEPRPKQGVEGRMPAFDKWMRRRGQIDGLTSEHIQFLGRVSKPLEVGQVRMKVKRRYSI